MAVFEYLKKQLTDLVKTFKNAKVNYEYDEIARIHTVEVLPQSVFDSDEFAKWECRFFEVAFKAIPGEDVGFISENAYVGIEHVDWSLQGDDYSAVDDILDDHISQCQSEEQIDSFNQTLAEYDWKQPTDYSTLVEASCGTDDFCKLDNKYIDFLILNNKTTVMMLDDSLSQAA